MDYRAEYEKWITSPCVSEEEKRILQGFSDDEIYDAFYRYAEFGTGGMRGIMGSGTNRLNRHTIRMAAKALADMMPEKARVVVAYDTRNNSRLFAEETAKVLAAAGVKAYLFDRYSPVPLLSFAVRSLKADGGVVITASHNTKEYNGFKVYDETGCQMLPERTEMIAKNMQAMSDPFDIEVVDMDDAIIDMGMIVPIGEDISGEFCRAAERCGGEEATDAASDLKVIYTSLHGSGRDYVMRTLTEAGFDKVKLVPEQAEFDGDFPTVSKPNPEDPGVFRYAADMALEENADIIIGTDPDCDRVGVGEVRRSTGGGQPEIVYFTGNQIGALLIDYLCTTCETAGRRLVTTIVTSQIGPAIAESCGIDVQYVLTGFKYIGSIMNEMSAGGEIEKFLMGYEESYGYLTGDHARDKDGVSSALVICRMAAHHKARGRSLSDVLADIYDRFGFWLDDQESLVFEGAGGEESMRSIMSALREKKGGLFCSEDERGGEVKYEDFLTDDTGLPEADVLKYLFGDGSWIAVRPSGTEPKIKIYYCMRGNDEAEAHARKQAAADSIRSITDAYMQV